MPDSVGSNAKMTKTRVRMRTGGRARSLDPKQEAAVVIKRAAGATLSELAKEYEVSTSIIWRVGNRSVDRRSSSGKFRSERSCVK